jgi:acetylornithine deacetylase
MKHNLVVCGTSGEETGRLGAFGFRDYLKAQGIVLDEMMVTEPSLCTPVYAHKGTVRLTYEIKGRAAHSSKPHLGANALVAAAQLITALDEEHERMQRERTGPLGAPTLTPTLSAGGHGLNIVPESAYVSVDYRVTTPGAEGVSEDVDEVFARLSAIADKVLVDNKHCTGYEVSGSWVPVVCVSVLTHSNFQVVNLNQDNLSGNPAFFQDPSHPFVKQLEGWTDLKAETVTYGTNATGYDASVMKACCICGPGDIEQAHMADEFVAVEQLVKFETVLASWLSLE